MSLLHRDRDDLDGCRAVFENHDFTRDADIPWLVLFADAATDRELEHRRAEWLALFS